MILRNSLVLFNYGIYWISSSSNWQLNNAYCTDRLIVLLFISDLSLHDIEFQCTDHSIKYINIRSLFDPLVPSTPIIPLSLLYCQSVTEASFLALPKRFLSIGNTDQ